MLSDEQIKQYWSEDFKNSWVKGWVKWREQFTAFVEWADQLGADDLRKDDVLERMWNAREAMTLGPGDYVSLGAARHDPDVIEAIADLRGIQAPTDLEERADYLQDRFENMKELIRPMTKRLPNARIKRVFVTLFPADLHSVLIAPRAKQVVELVLGEKRGLPLFRYHVLVRGKLRSVLGEEQSIKEQVERSIFCWWLHEQYEHLMKGSVGGAKELVAGPVGEEQPLKIWPFGKQLKGTFAIPGMDQCYRDLVQAAVEGASRDDVISELGDDPVYETFSAKSLRMTLVRVKKLGFIEEKDGQCYPTQDGEDLLENEQADILVERLFERVFGMAQLIRILEESSKPLSRMEVYTALQKIYPRWTSLRVPGALVNWAKALGLVEIDESKARVLTEYGRSWARRLPKKLPGPPAADTSGDIDDEEGIDPELSHGGLGAAEDRLKTNSLDAIVAAMAQDEETKDFVFEASQVAALHLAWHSNPRKRFVILSGLSGTGKTAITLCYSKVYCQLSKVDPDTHREVVAVSPDWRDPTGLLGYFNALHEEPTFQAEPALRLLIRAAKDPERPYFLVLDEMNLARVERYFANFLSSMETGEPLVLHGGDGLVNGIPSKLAWPRNLFIAGTVNMDETTKAFSDKVLDRAFTLEFWEVDLEEFFSRRAAKSGGERAADVEALLVELNGLLRPIRRHFGYRSADEILRFMEQAGDGDGRAGLLDHAVFSKVLPRLRGEETGEFRDALTKLGKACVAHQLARCTTKIEEIGSRMAASGVARFWG